jgi:uncharacterized protein YjbI with pentapeptide repeats
LIVTIRQGAGAGVVAEVVAEAGAVAVAVALKSLVALTVAGVVAYSGWRAIKGDTRDTWIRDLALTFAAIGATSFRNAKLSQANFTGAKLKSTDFRKANLTLVRW